MGESRTNESRGSITFWPYVQDQNVGIEMEASDLRNRITLTECSSGGFYQQLKGWLLPVFIFSWNCCSMIVEASKEPRPVKILMWWDKAKIFLFPASHKCRRALVRLSLVAKKVTYWCTSSLSAKSLRSYSSAVGKSTKFDNKSQYSNYFLDF